MLPPRSSAVTLGHVTQTANVIHSDAFTEIFISDELERRRKAGHKHLANIAIDRSNNYQVLLIISRTQCVHNMYFFNQETPWEQSEQVSI